MNKFLASLEITFRRDPTNYRPRVNKLNSVKDREQKGTSNSLVFHLVSSNPILFLFRSLGQLLLPRGIILKVPAQGIVNTLLGIDLGPRGIG